MSERWGTTGNPTQPYGLQALARDTAVWPFLGRITCVDPIHGYNPVYPRPCALCAELTNLGRATSPALPLITMVATF